MRPRKIEDGTLLDMLNRGISQQEIAKNFRVSPAAICQRLKRLLPKPDLDKYSLTEPQKRFVEAKAKGKTNTQAALASYEIGSLDSAKVIGSQLMDKPEIKMAIDDLMNHHGLSRSYRIGRLRSHVDNRDPNIALKALDMTWKLDGGYAPEKHIYAEYNTRDIVDHFRRQAAYFQAEIDKLQAEASAEDDAD